MRKINSLFYRVAGFLIFLVLSLGSVAANEIRYMEVIHSSPVVSRIGSEVKQAGRINRGQILEILNSGTEYYQFQFGNGRGYIAKHVLKELAHYQPEPLRAVATPVTNQNLITNNAVTLYSQADIHSPVLGLLEGNLRYPISGKLLDKQKNGWYEIRLGGKAAFVRQDECEFDMGVPVLTYHHLLRDKENKLFQNTSTTTSDTAFTAQMNFLKEAGYQTLSLYQLESYLNNQINLPGKAVALTFDDGLKSVYRYAYPVLNKLGFKATAFVISSRIKRYPQKWDPDSLQFMSISELRTIQHVFDIQTHTHFLHRFAANRQPILLVRNYHNILFDFERSRRALTQFNPHVVYLAYPFGGYDQKAIAAARDAGLHLAFTTVQGKVRPGDPPYTLKRLYILRTDPIELMEERLGNGEQRPYTFVGE